MQKNKTKKDIIVIEGPSGVGKDSVIAALMARHPNRYQKIISVTTRPMRFGETNGSPYFFVNRDQFEEMLRTHEIFEFTQRHGTYRGMSKFVIDKILNEGKTAIKDADIVGVRALKKTYPNRVLTIFLTARKEEIEKRLTKRGDTPEDKARRLHDYDSTMKQKQFFDFVVENNDTLDEAVENVHNIIVRHEYTKDTKEWKNSYAITKPKQL